MTSQITDIETSSNKYHGVSFEDLPEELLLHIFELLETKEILKMSKLSMLCRSHANTRLYKKIRVLHSGHFEHVFLYYQTYSSQVFTGIQRKKLPILIHILERNPKIAKLIKAVHIPASANDKLISKFLSLLSLTELYDNFSTPYRLSNLQYLKKFAYSPHTSNELNRFGELPQQYFQNLVELKLGFRYDPFWAIDWTALAEFLMKNNAYQNIRTLALISNIYFEKSEGRGLDTHEFRDVNKNYLEKTLSIRRSRYNHSLYFLDIFSNRGCKLNLTRLHLCSINMNDSADRVLRAIEPTRLLAFQVSDTHMYDPEDKITGASLLLSEILKHTTSVEDFCLFTETTNVQFWRTFLQYLRPNQLKKICIRFNFSSDELFPSLIYETIMRSQCHLEVLTMEGKTGSSIQTEDTTHKLLSYCKRTRSYIRQRELMERHLPVMMYSDLGAIKHRNTFPFQKDYIRDKFGKSLQVDPKLRSLCLKLPFLKRFSLNSLDYIHESKCNSQ